MSFLSPLFLAGAIAIVVPIALHLLNRHTEQRVRFAAVALLKGAPVEHTSRRLRSPPRSRRSRIPHPSIRSPHPPDAKIT